MMSGLANADDQKMNPPTLEQLKSIVDISDSDILPDYVQAVIENAEGEFYDQKVRHAVENHFSIRTSQWHFVTSFLGLWGNGGMQSVLLCEGHEIEHKQWELKNTAEAFRAFGCKKTAEFIEHLIPKSAEWSKAIAKLNAREANGEDIPEEEFDKIWSEVDKFDDPFDEGFEEDPDIYQAMTEDIRANPEEYLPPAKMYSDRIRLTLGVVLAG